jgi:glycosyltransferase involved in cell wall biosynthesis
METHRLNSENYSSSQPAGESSSDTERASDVPAFLLPDRSDAVDLSVVIPVYNSATIMPALLPRLRKVLDALDMTYELVMVDDGSPDDSWRVLSAFQQQDPEHIVAVQLMRNYGQHNALMCGFRHARGDYVVTMDDDLQHPPEELPKLLAAISSSDLDLVYGSYDRKKHARPRNIASWIVNRFYRFVFQLPVTVTSFRMMRRELVATILPYSLNFTYIDGLLAWNTRRIGEVTVEHHPRAKGRSGYRLRKLVSLALNLFTNFSLLPLQMVSLCGLLAAISGFILGLYYFYLHLTSSIIVPGYASTIVSILVLGGLQLLGLGIMGEYVGRLHLNVNRKPQYNVRRIRSGDEHQINGGSNVHRISDSRSADDRAA